MTGAGRLAFVVQRCGREVNGGSEKLCLDVARHLGAQRDVEILTTCAVDYQRWSNHYAPGPGEIDGVPVRRFRVARERDVEAFDRLSEGLRPRIGGLDRHEEEEWIRAQGPDTPDLLAFLREHRNDYDAFFFFTYLYATSYFGLAEVADRAVLVPCAHDEWPIYLSVWNDYFQRPRALAYNTPEEQAFVARRFGKLDQPHTVAGAGVEPPEPGSVDSQAFARRHGIDGAYLLYLGRLDPSKGCEELFDLYRRYREQRPGAPSLALVGSQVMPVPDDPGVVSVGFVDEQSKWEALAGCAALVMPSPYESLSIALLEAWSQSRPVLVNGHCEVLVGQTRRARGGLWYRDPAEFALTLDRILDPATGAALGRQGAAFAQSCSWERVTERYLALLG